jgi:Prokaryotic dksA/traR C4-type zinc finger
MTESEIILCGICDGEIPPARLRALPGTQVCVRCSKEIGGEAVLEVRAGTVGAKQGSLKKTGEEIHVKLKKRTWK